MELAQFIGFPIDVVIEKLKKNNLKYEIFESSKIQKKFDNILVVNLFERDDGVVEIWTDKFLIYV